MEETLHALDVLHDVAIRDTDRVTIIRARRGQGLFGARGFIGFEDTGSYLDFHCANVLLQAAW